MKMFANASGYGYTISEFWVGMAQSIDMNYNGRDVSSKYNDPLKKYRRKKLETKESGAGSSCVGWKFWTATVSEIKSGSEHVAPKCFDDGNVSTEVAGLTSEFSEELEIKAKRAKNLLVVISCWNLLKKIRLKF